jgi:beta-lactamase regulating signal transducer with metallopeptidase domain
MSGLAMGWLPRGESMALGWTLLHFCWQGTAVAAAYAFADRLTLRASPVVRYAVATGALALMPLLVLTTFASEVRTVTSIRPSVKVSAEVLPLIGRGIQEPVSLQDAVSLVSVTGERRGWLAGHTERVLPWVDGLWMLGVLLLAVRTMGGWRQLERLRRRATGMVPAHVEQSFLGICERVNVGRRVILRVSDQVISPMAMGVWRATVILPASALLSLTEEELGAVLAHELGHIRRWDYAWNLLQTALETVLFFHPAVWWLSRKVRDRREVCCDEIAVQSCSDPIVYAQTLLRLEEQKLRGLRLAVAQRGSSGSLLARVKKVLGEDEPMENGITGGVRVAVASMVVIGLLLGPKVSDAVAGSKPAAMSAPVSQSSSVEKNRVETKSNGTVVTRVARKHALTGAQDASAQAPGDSPAVEITSLRSDARAASGLAMMQAESKPESKGASYIDGMRDAGYPLDLNNDLNTLISLKSLGVTPEYAKQMGALGFGKPSVHELISLKALGVTPEYIAELKQSGLGPKDFHEVTTEKALGITPQYAAEMKKTGFGDMNLQELISLKAQNVTPEYVAWLKQQFPQITLDELRRAAVFHLDDKFLAAAKSHGFDGKDLDKLLRLKMSGLLDE